MSKSQRTKGAAFEREVVLALRAAGIEAARNLTQTRDGGGDIDLGRYMLECKRRASIAAYAWLDQCAAAAREGQVPVVVARADKRGAIVIMRFSDWMKALE